MSTGEGEERRRGSKERVGEGGWEEGKVPAVKEFRIPLPIPVQAYQRGLLHTVVDLSRQETGDGEGVEHKQTDDFQNKEFLGGKYTTGTYTKKIYHLHQHFPKWMRWAISQEKCQFVEEAWNAHPYCLTEVRNPNFMKDDFYVFFETLCLPFNGTFEDNALQLEEKRLKLRDVEILDIANDELIKKEDYKKERDPKVAKVKGTVLDKDWMAKGQATMCVYKVVTLHFHFTGLSQRIKSFAMGPGGYSRVFTKLHRELYCTLDTWSPLSLAQIRAMETALVEELVRLRKAKEYRGSPP